LTKFTTNNHLEMKNKQQVKVLIIKSSSGWVKTGIRK